MGEQDHTDCLKKLVVKLTIVVPTYNAPDYLRRCLAYFDSYALPLKIIVADSSREENKKVNRQIVRSVKNLQVTYYGEFDPEIKPFLKWFTAVTKVKTKYMVFCADDDFLSLEGAFVALDYLRNHPGYSAVEGKNIFYLNCHFLGTHKFIWKEGDARDSFENDHPAGRLSSYTDYSPVLYAVTETEKMRYFFQQAIENDSIEFPFGEFLPAFLTVLHGKVKRLDIFYSARDKTIDFQRMPQINIIQQCLEENTLQKKCLDCRKPLVQDFAKVAGCDISRAGEVMDQFLTELIKKQKSKMYVLIFRRIFGNTFVYGWFAKLYIFLKWVNFNPYRSYHLHRLLRDSSDFRRIKWFVKHYRIRRPPVKEKFIR